MFLIPVSAFATGDTCCPKDVCKCAQGICCQNGKCVCKGKCCSDKACKCSDGKGCNTKCDCVSH